MKKKNGRSASLATTHEGDQGFWPSYADMMSAVALILFFLMLLAYIQNLITGKELNNTKDLLSDTLSKLSITQLKVQSAEQELNTITASLDSARAEVAAQQSTINEQLKNIDQQQEVINAQKLTLDEQLAMLNAQLETLNNQKAVIDAQEIQAREQEQYLASTQKEITELRGQMQTIAVLRLSILEQIRDSIASVMGDADKVSIGENGSIILSENILFDFGSAQVKENSTQVLNQLANVFAKFLSDNENARYVDSIVISGHTDNVGREDQNRTLSTNRANSVLSYLLTANNRALEPYAQYFCAAGYGYTRPVADNETAEGRAANRRIEISMILKDETVLEIVEQYLNIKPPVG